MAKLLIETDKGGTPTRHNHHQCSAVSVSGGLGGHNVHPNRVLTLTLAQIISNREGVKLVDKTLSEYPIYDHNKRMNE